MEKWYSREENYTFRGKTDLDLSALNEKPTLSLEEMKSSIFHSSSFFFNSQFLLWKSLKDPQ
ncbi:MAG: hypothetical protein AYK18_11860 [Theionarchaea archaeon DG-70]|nr:MAG: hypothetical protein AYK18_11860 [Theionarchaea archaeon DG-70]